MPNFWKEDDDGNLHHDPAPFRLFKGGRYSSQGSSSLLDGLVVGCTIEDLDILDLKNHLLEVDNQDFTLVFNNLMRGSRNHLRSFYANVLFSGGTYVP